MTKTKPMLTMVAVLTGMLLAGAGSAAFAAPQGNPDVGIKGPPQGQLGPPQQQPPQQQPPPQQPPPQSITGGTGVPDGKYPFIAALLDMRDTGSAYDKFFAAAP